MRLGAKLLDTSATLNQFKYVQNVSIAQGETINLFFQLVDQEQNCLRYIPATGATLMFLMPRTPLVFTSPGNSRTVTDYSISRAAINPFPQDTSIWQVTLLGTDTQTMVSNSIKLVLTEGSLTKIATINQAIRMIDGQDE